jgi:hypothetical protein
MIDVYDESDALHTMNNLKSNATGNIKNMAHNILCDKGFEAVKKMLRR